MRKVFRETAGGFGMPAIIQEGGCLFGGSVTEASMWLDANGDIHVTDDEFASEFVKKQISDMIERLQANPDAKTIAEVAG